ncbi:MAG: GTPase Era, partial [Cyanobacteria bacterium NC_groundwater_1444_Ag_S-0.65um_54_12]|nr:GTPase Era [Cyanobacteria bacterium NC_groundwater_1444_Ag_S-0.65um_54_12]
QLLDETVAAYRDLASWVGQVAISAQRGKNCEKLLRLLEAKLPVGPPYYDEETITDQTLRQLAGEFIREQVLRQTAEEVPHAVAIKVEEWIERSPKLTIIRATIFVERASQKGILIGEDGRMLRLIGERARQEIEKLLEHQVFLELWVKVLPHWRRQKAALKQLGYLTSGD